MTGSPQDGFVTPGSQNMMLLRARDYVSILLIGSLDSDN